MYKKYDIKQSGLSKEVVQKIRSCFPSFKNILKVILFGSRAKGSALTGSDIDLCLIGDQITQEDLSLLLQCLDDLNLPYTFDIILYKDIDNSQLKSHIHRVGQVFYEKNLADN